MKRKASVLLLVILLVSALLVPTVLAAGDPDAELADLRENIKSIEDIDSTVYNKLENIMLQKFPDVKRGEWYMSVMAKLVGLGALDGTNEGLLDPSATVTRAQFIKMFIRAMYGADAVNNLTADFNHWTAKDVKKAEEIGVLATREYYIDNIDQPISRGEMAKLIVRAYMQFETNPLSYDECNTYATVIKDYHQIPAEYQPYVLVTYGAGIIAGYPDGRSGGTDTATRAQAAAFIIRYLDKNERIKVEKPNTTKREPTILRWDDPYRPVPQEGDIFVKPDGTQVVLKIGPAGVLGENQNCDIWGGMIYPSGNVLKEGKLGIDDWGHLGETYLIDDYGEGHFWSEWKEIMQYYGRRAREEVKNPKDGQTYGKWFKYALGQWCWTGPVNQGGF